MKFKVDENLPVDVAEILRSAGHDALTVLDQRLGGTPDQVIADVVRREDRALISLDLDFADLRTFPPSEFAGVIVLRLPTQDMRTITSAMLRLVGLFESEPLKGTLWIVDSNTVRIRGEKS